MPVSGGLMALGGIGEGLKNFVSTYLEAKKIKQQQALDTQRLGLMAREKGLMYNPDDEAKPFTETPLYQSQQELKQAQTARELQEEDPDSPVSQQRNQFVQGLMKHYGVGDVVPGGMSAQSLEGKNSLIPEILKSEAQSKALAQRVGMQGERIEQRGQINAQGQVSSAEKQFTPRLEGAARIKGIWDQIDSGKIKNNEAAKSLIISEIQRLETGASNPAFEAQTQKEMGTQSQRLKELVQSWTGEPQDTVPPGVTKQLKNLSDELASTYMDQADSAFDVLKAGARPEQLRVIESKQKALQDTYGKRFNGWKKSQSQGLLSGAVSPHPQDAEALQWAKQNPTDPKAAAIMKANGAQ